MNVVDCADIPCIWRADGAPIERAEFGNTSLVNFLGCVRLLDCMRQHRENDKASLSQS
jgi:hypothetical protein